MGVPLQQTSISLTVSVGDRDDNGILVDIEAHRLNVCLHVLVSFFWWIG